MRLRCGGYQGEASVHTRALRTFAAHPSLASADLEPVVTANITADGHKAADLLGQVDSGERDLCYFASSYLADRVPALGVLDLPFSVSDRISAYRKLDGTLGRLLAEATAARTGFRVLGFWDNGFRHLTNRLRPIRAPADCAGMTIRTLDNALHQEIFRTLGFRPAVIDVKDLPAAVASGAVDAQENPLTNTLNFGLHRAHRHVSLTAHFFGVALLLANRAWFDGLSAARRAAIEDAARVATTAQRGFAAREDIDGLARLRQEGCDILGSEALDLRAFREALADIKRRETARIDGAVMAAFADER